MKKYFFTGLVLLLPIVVTLMIITFVVRTLTHPFMGFVSHFITQYNLGDKSALLPGGEKLLIISSQLVILVCLFVFILLLGMIARWFFVHWLIRFGEYIVHRLPLVNKVYKTSKEIVSHLFGQDKKSFKQVVLVPFPREGIYTIGFLSEKAPKEINDETQSEMISVFVPTTPNPTTGFTVIYKVKDIYYLKMKPEAAIKFIVSCGIVHPEDIKDGTIVPKESKA
ncbi:MAG: hypothetical protein S4CHLAM20_05210 [Chlamydiia bacterium]|nr:hypothetical protein [Chlamydiia bacterium]